MGKWGAMVALAVGALAGLGFTATRADGGFPAGDVRLVPLILPSGSPPLRVFLDPGHGAPDNPGNTSAFCEPEQLFTLSLAEDVARELEALGAFEVALSRRGELVDYHERVREAEVWGAEVFVSLHSDVRGEGEPWSPAPGQRCVRSREAPGFTVLVSDGGAAAESRLALARATAHWMGAAGFSAYDGRDYGAVYAPDRAGVFLDRHAAEERIFVLYRPSMPSILIETHHALDDREVLRWREPEVRAAFARALAAALLEARPPHSTF